MRPKILLLDEPCNEARKMLEQVFDYKKEGEIPDIVYTQLTPCRGVGVPVICPCTSVEHITASPHVIYLDEAWKRGEGVKVTSTAEHTFSLILQLAKLKRMQLSGKIIGIIGFGRIGQQVLEYVKAFDMSYIIYSEGFEKQNYEDILKYSDIITLHVPLNDSTKGMIGKEQFDPMKDGVLLVNTSRADIVDKYSLCDNLHGGKLGGYADDFKDHWAIHHDNVIQTNHVGGNSIEAREATDIYIAKRAIEWWRARSRTHAN